MITRRDDAHHGYCNLHESSGRKEGISEQLPSSAYTAFWLFSLRRATEHSGSAINQQVRRTEINLMVPPSDLVAWLTPNMDNPVPVDVDTQYNQREVVALWEIPLKGHVHKIEFEHGTASGRRVIWVDQKEVLRREWMFKLVGEDSFQLDGVRCIIRVEPAPGFSYTYHLFVDGKPFKQFTERQARILKAWETSIAGKDYRIVLGECWPIAGWGA